MGWNAWTAVTNVADKIGVGLSTVATGYLKASELIPGVDYSNNETIQAIYTNSDRMTDPISKVVDPLVEWTVETGAPGVVEVGAYAATMFPVTAPAMAIAAHNGIIDKEDYIERVNNIVGYGRYITTEPLDAAGQAGQGLLNAGTTTVGLVADVARGAVNYSDDALVGLYNLGIENPEEKADDWYHPLGDREGQFFGVMTWMKDGTQFMPTISNQIENAKGDLVDDPNAKYKRLTRYSFQAGGEVGAMIVTGGTLGAVWGTMRGAKVVTTTVRAGEELAEVAAKTTAKATQEAAEATAKTGAATTEKAAETTAKASTATATETTAKTGAATSEKAVETTAKTTTASAEKTAEGSAQLSSTAVNETSKTAATAVAEETAKVAPRAQAVAEESAKASFNTSATAANEAVEGTAKIAVNGQSQTVTATVTNAVDDAAVEITQVGGKMGVADTSMKAANEVAEEVTEQMVRVRGVEGAKEGFANGVKFMDPRASKAAASAEVAGVTATLYMETTADKKSADQATKSSDDVIKSVQDSIINGYEEIFENGKTSHSPSKLSPQFPQSDPQSSLNTEFTNRANATQQALETVGGKPIFTIALNEEDALNFTRSLKV